MPESRLLVQRQRGLETGVRTEAKISSAKIKRVAVCLQKSSQPRMYQRVLTKDAEDAHDFSIAPLLRIFSQNLAIVVYSRRIHEDCAACEPHGSIQLA